jgi:flagellar hook assembly protein FlgD
MKKEEKMKKIFFLFLLLLLVTGEIVEATSTITVEAATSTVATSTTVVKATATKTTTVAVNEAMPTLTSFTESVYAFPNPAKDGWVKFVYTLAKDANVTLKIFTIMGDLVWEAEYDDSAGPEIMHGWDCRNEAGEKVASGLYIYRLTANDETKEITVTKKLIVIQ